MVKIGHIIVVQVFWWDFTDLVGFDGLKLLHFSPHQSSFGCDELANGTTITLSARSLSICKIKIGKLKSVDFSYEVV